MRRADRLFQLVQTLRTRRFATGRELGEALGVSVRTVYRDVRDLQYSGVRIRGEAGVGYALDRDYELAPLTFTTEELEGLALGARFVAAWGDAELASAIGSAMTKIEAVIPEALRPALLDTPLFAPAFESAARMAQHMGLVRRAISEQRLIHFAYTREDGARSERDVRPLALYFWGNKWTLATWCELRRDYRSFRPDRMEDVAMLDATHDGEDGVTLAAFLAQADSHFFGEETRGIKTPSLRR
ncbi:MAG: YafY family protein [Proteobacteria bacterium]|nr:YafY family protein [Pseudomonadota bacterium]